MAASRQSNLAKLEEHSDALCILEMKPVRRKAKKLPIAMQEAAEMAAWISTEHELGLLPSFQSDAAGNAKRYVYSILTHDINVARDIIHHDS
jgi:hypothetical protein